MLHLRHTSIMLALGAILLPVFCLSVSAEEPKPWTLRDRYSFSGPSTSFNYDAKTAEWMVDVKGLGHLILNAQTEFFYNDKTVRLNGLEVVSERREDTNGPFGGGKNFWSVFRAPEGFHIESAIGRFSERPFLVLRTRIVNNSKEPVVLKEIRPAVFPPGSINLFGGKVNVRLVRTDVWGDLPSYRDGDHASLVRFESRRPQMTLGIGVLEAGRTDSKVTLRQEGGHWVGHVTSVFDPPIRIDPGESLDAAPVWFSFSVPDPTAVQEYHHWAQSQYPREVHAAAAPKLWIGIEEGRSIDDLYEAARDDSKQTITYLLVPRDWESKPGSFRGNSPRFPRDMEQIPESLRKMGRRAGIAFDPLACTKTNDSWCLASVDGSGWVDMRTKQGKKAAQERAQKLAEWGYAFLMVEPSHVPDAVLQRYNMTRSEADRLALDAVREAVPGLPVVPTPSVTMTDDQDLWRDATDTMAWYKLYGSTASPIRIRMNDLKGVPEKLAQLMRDYPGSIEIQAPGSKRLYAEFAPVLAFPERAAAPENAVGRALKD